MNVWVNGIICLCSSIYSVYYLSYKLVDKNKIKALPGIIFFFIWTYVVYGLIGLYSKLGLL